MCGIFGYIAWDAPLPDVDRLRRVTNLLRHRGPDSGAYWSNAQAFLGHRRLAIIDLAGGDQPMVSADDRYVITYNGEVYNYIELREELRARGCRFSTASDTEVVLAAYQEWGPAMAGRLAGMFALAIYDRRERTLYLARDRFGEKPLLVAHGAHGVVFASELSPIAAIHPPARQLDEEALADYLCLNYVPGSRTLSRAVRRVPPAEWQLFGRDAMIRTERYWHPPAAPEGTTSTIAGRDVRAEAGILDELQERVDRAIAITLRSDVPVGLFLSGGIDSSLVAESAARQGKLACAFSIDMQDTGFSEWPAARFVAEKVGVEIERVPFSVDLLDRLPELVSHADDPLADSSALAVWCISKRAANRVKVVLSGDGGDELFGGYLTYTASAAHARIAQYAPMPVRRLAAWSSGLVPANDLQKVSTSYKLRRFLRAAALPTGQAHFTWNGTWLPAEAATIVKAGDTRNALTDALGRLAERHGFPARPRLHDLQCADLEDYLPNDILTKVDRMTMAHGLESRAPLLNPDVADLALGLPLLLRAGPMGAKVALRKLCERHFGAAHARAPKQGFSLPIHAWLRRDGGRLVTTILNRGRVEATAVLEPSAVNEAVQAHLRGRRALGWELWGLMVFVLWHEQRIGSVPHLPDADDVLQRPLTAERGSWIAQA